MIVEWKKVLNLLLNYKKDIFFYRMCRGQYYMVWRSLMEHVEDQNIIRQKRLQVFSDDVKICQEKNTFNEVCNLFYSKYDS